MIGRVQRDIRSAQSRQTIIGPIAQALESGLFGYVFYWHRWIIEQAMLATMLALKYNVTTRRALDFLYGIVPIHGDILMLTISGPQYRYQGERLDRAEIIVIRDHHYDPESGYALQKLLDASICPADQHLLVFDHVLRQDEFARYPHVCLPLLLAAECEEFTRESIEINWENKTWAFNFMVNKPRKHREILMDLVHELELTSYRHSLCWASDYKSIARTDYRFGDEQVMDQGILNGQHRNAATYARLLKTKVFEPTCLSLITEPAFYERETIITEKTLMAIWAGTLPLWVGGWRCADVMRELGFDVFDDVIDHGYQDLSDPVERCQQAMYRNQHLLVGPIDLSSFHARMFHNLSLLRKNVFLTRVRDIMIEYPALKVLLDFRDGLLVRD